MAESLRSRAALRAHVVREPERAADNEGRRAPCCLIETGQIFREGRRGEILSPFVEHDGHVMWPERGDEALPLGCVAFFHGQRLVGVADFRYGEGPETGDALFVLGAGFAPEGRLHAAHTD